LLAVLTWSRRLAGRWQIFALNAAPGRRGCRLLGWRLPLWRRLRRLVLRRRLLGLRPDRHIAGRPGRIERTAELRNRRTHAQ
jgi:hypothetical protein